jgi:hypothetical protein
MYTLELLIGRKASLVSPDLVQQLAAHAEKSDPSIVDNASAFYAQHPAVVKTLADLQL